MQRNYDPKCRTKPLFAAEIAEHAEEPAEGTSHNKNHGSETPGRDPDLSSGMKPAATPNIQAAGSGS